MTEKISDNVGKKIVEALKMHNSGEESLVTKPNHSAEESVNLPLEKNIQQNTFDNPSLVRDTQEFNNIKSDSAVFNSAVNSNDTQVNIDSILQNAINQNLGSMSLPEVQSDFEYPNNVAILNHLITKLPAGVTKQTGAIIIKQTMEALGIPMKSVIREAQQVQDLLALRTKECQKNIIECRKQIATLEIKVQQYQKQAVVMNDIISLFMGTGI